MLSAFFKQIKTTAEGGHAMHPSMVITGIS